MEEENRILKVLESPNSMETKDTEEEKEEEKPIPRLLTMDFLRGFCIYVMALTHQMRAMYYVEGLYNFNFSKLDPVFAIFGGFILFFSTFTSLFLIISIIVNVFASTKRVQKGAKPEGVMIKQVITGFVIMLYGYLFEMILHPNGLIGNTILRGNDPVEFMLRRFFTFGTLHMIGFGLIVTGILHYLLVLKPMSKGKDTYLRALLTYISIAVCIYIITPFIARAIENSYSGFPGIAYDGKQWEWPILSASDFFRRWFYVNLVGRYEPMLPFLATALIGAIIGMTLSPEKPPKRFPLQLFGFASILMIPDLIMGLKEIIQGTNNFLYYSQSAPMYFISLWGQLSVLSLIMYFVEFKGYNKKLLKGSRFFRRYGAISLTVYSLEIMAVPPRYFMQIITGWYVADKAIDHYSDTVFWQMLITVIVVMLFWEGVIRLWEKIKFVGSFEWINSKLFTIGQKIPKTSKKNLVSLVYNIEPITFVQ